MAEHQGFVEISPFQNVITKTWNYFNLSVRSVELYKRAEIVVSLFDENKNYVDTQFLTIDGEDYSNWGNDDSYINAVVIKKLGLVPLVETSTTSLTPSSTEATPSS